MLCDDMSHQSIKHLLSEKYASKRVDELFSMHSSNRNIDNAHPKHSSGTVSFQVYSTGLSILVDSLS